MKRWLYILLEFNTSIFMIIVFIINSLSVVCWSIIKEVLTTNGLCALLIGACICLCQHNLLNIFLRICCSFGFIFDFWIFSLQFSTDVLFAFSYYWLYPFTVIQITVWFHKSYYVLYFTMWFCDLWDIGIAATGPLCLPFQSPYCHWNKAWVHGLREDLRDFPCGSNHSP